MVMMAALAALAPFCSGYYYYVLLNNSGGVWTPIPAHFDLNPADTYGVPNNTVTYVISSQGPTVLMPGDSFQAVVSQIRAAANVWNSVNSSGVQLAFGGLSAMNQTDAVPEVDVVFTGEVTPGLIAMTVVSTASTPVTPAGGGAPFVPILNSEIELQTNMGPAGPYPQGSWSDAFFLTVAHEFGHSLGLQHTKASSLMTTVLTRSTTKAQPLGADDIAGISQLYPTGGFLTSTGSISGRVAMGGNGVNLATVMALSTNGAAIGTLTNPDGTYQINGIPPGEYYVFTQPLPPPIQGEAYPDNVKPPIDTNGNTYAATNGFMGQFYGGTNDWTQAPQVNVSAGNVSNGVNFNVVASAGPSVYDMSVYSYIGNPAVPVQGPPLVQGTAAALEFYAWSATNATGFVQLVPGLNISLIGGAAQVVPNTLANLQGGYPYLYNDVWLGSATTPTPVAMSVTLNGDLYVLPAAFTVVQSTPVTVTSASGSTDNNGNALVTVSGTNLGTSSRILFDGAPATILNVNSNGSLTVTPPPAASGYTANVEALNPDGQSSEQTLGSAAPAQFTYGGPASPSFSVSPATVTAGTDTMVRITGYNTNFVMRQMAIGFGSSDVLVKQIWVVSPQSLLLNVSVAGASQAESTILSVASGLEFETLSTPFQIAAANGVEMSLRTPILSQATQLAGVPTGGIAAINTSGLPASLAGWTLTIGGQAAQFTYNGSQILALVPGGLVVGPQTVQLTTSNGVAIPPVEMQVDQAPPAIIGVADASGAMLSGSQSAQPGQTILLTVTGLADPYGDLPSPSEIMVNIGGMNVNPISVTPLSATACQLQLVIPATATAGNATITVQVGTRLSGSYTIPVQ